MLKIIGELCKRLRIRLGYSQNDVADATGYSSENVSAFECGRNNNAIILFWYILHGFNYDFIMNDESEDKYNGV